LAQNFTLSGTVADQNTNETLIGASVYVVETKTGAVTNEYGFYSLSLPAGTYTLKISYYGFADFTQTVSLDKNTRKNVSMSASTQ
ncbi:carboxypeptidase-like regulatory domain-containing protein, partial [Acinetobacter baumannii]